jgi:hypothetical protein
MRSGHSDASWRPSPLPQPAFLQARAQDWRMAICESHWCIVCECRSPTSFRFPCSLHGVLRLSSPQKWWSTLRGQGNGCPPVIPLSS